MKLVLTLLPVILLSFSLFIYRFNGRKELLKMDLVQFFYAFVLAPAIIIWLKSVVFYNFSREIGIILDSEDLFLIDNAVTILCLYIYAFVVIHSLTKTFKLKVEKDPLFNIFERSEYFHLWLTHVVTFSAGLFIMLLIGMINIFLPFSLASSKQNLFTSVVIGVVLGFIFYIGMRFYKDKEAKKFKRLIKFELYICAFFLLLTYIVIRPKYSPEHLLFWCSVFFFITATTFTQLGLRNKFTQPRRLGRYSAQKIL